MTVRRHPANRPQLWSVTVKATFPDSADKIGWRLCSSDVRFRRRRRTVTGYTWPFLHAPTGCSQSNLGAPVQLGPGARASATGGGGSWNFYLSHSICSADRNRYRDTTGELLCDRVRDRVRDFDSAHRRCKTVPIRYHDRYRGVTPTRYKVP